MTGTLDNDQIFLNRLTGIIHENLSDENFAVKQLAQKSGMSLYRLNRRLHSINKKTSNQFIREVRLIKALELLKNEEFSATEVAYMVGFSSPAYFSKCFHDNFGYPPGKVKDSGAYNKRISYGAKIKMLRFLPFISLLVIVSFILVYLKTADLKSFKDRDTSDNVITLLVLPFRNLTNDTMMDIWQDGIQTNMIALLSNTEEFKVRQIENINEYLQYNGFTHFASITPSVANEISRKLQAKVFLYGGIIQSGNSLRLTAQLIDTEKEEIINSFQVEGNSEEILRLITKLSESVKNSIVISLLQTENPAGLNDANLKSASSPEAYKSFILGNRAFYKNDFQTANKWYLQALEIDSGLYLAMAKISLSYYNENDYENGKAWCGKFYAFRDKMGIKDKIWADFLYALFFQTPRERIKSMEQMIAIDDQNPLTYFNIGDSYLELSEYNMAISSFGKAFEIFRLRDTKPFWGAFYYELGIAYHKNGQYREERRLYKNADKVFPGDPGLMDQHAWLALTSGDTVKANRYIENWTAIRKNESWSDASIASYLAYVFDMAGDTLKAEKALRKALSVEPLNPARMGSLAYFLIDYELDINEGMGLIDKALSLKPDSYTFLHNKGWGLYKLKRYYEALDLLQESWDLRMQNSIYNHKAWLHLEEAREAVSSQALKSN